MDVRALQTADLLSTARATAHRKPSGGSGEAASGSFAGVLEQAATRQTTRTTKTDTTSATPADGAEKTERAEIKLRKHETLKTVDGRAFSEIDGGKRDGLYVNTSGNVRHGETFTMTIRKGRELHIYGTGADRVIVSLPVKRDDDDRQSSSSVDRTGGTSVPTATQRD